MTLLLHPRVAVGSEPTTPLVDLTGQYSFRVTSRICPTYVLLRTSVSDRGFLTCFPRLDSRVSHSTLPAAQLVHGCRSVTSHFTRRALHVTHANFARFRGGSDMLPKPDICSVWKKPKSVTQNVPWRVTLSTSAIPRHLPPLLSLSTVAHCTQKLPNFSSSVRPKIPRFSGSDIRGN